MNKYTRTEQRCFALGRELRANAEAVNKKTDSAFRELDEQRVKDLEDLRRVAESRDATNRKRSE